MGFRGLIRDLLNIYIGFRLIIGLVIPLTINELLFSGFIIFGFSALFMFERLR